MKKDKILVPNFSLDGYSLTDARNKNTKGLCAFESCENNADSELFYMGLKVCKQCYKILLDGIAKDRAKEEMELWERVAGIVKEHNKSCEEPTEGNKE